MRQNPQSRMNLLNYVLPAVAVIPPPPRFGGAAVAASLQDDSSRSCGCPCRFCFFRQLARVRRFCVQGTDTANNRFSSGFILDDSKSIAVITLRRHRWASRSIQRHPALGS